MTNGAERIWGIARGFQPSRVLLTAVELGIFAALGDGEKTSAQVSLELDTDERAADRLMNALVALDLLKKQGHYFSNTAETIEFLVPGKPAYAGDALMHAVNMWDNWSTLTESVMIGSSILRREGEMLAAWAKPFIAAMNYNAQGRAEEIAHLLDLTGVDRLLDVGGGSGAYSIAFCRQYPHLQSVVFDLPEVLPLTRQYIQEAGMSVRINTVAGDYTVDDLGCGFDAVFLSAIIHINSPQTNIELFNRCRCALNHGGRIIIQDFIMDPNRTTPPFGALFALNMLVSTTEGDTYTEEEVRDWLYQTGFADVKRIDVPEAGTALMIATSGD